MIRMLYRIQKRTIKTIPVPRYKLPNSDCSLVIAPHMDDDIIGCGGTMKLMSEQGTLFHILYVTNGCRGNSNMTYDEKLGEHRKSESKKALDFLLGEEKYKLNFLDIEDGMVYKNKDGNDKIRQIVEMGNFDTVFVPYCLDIHPDHRASNYLFINSIKSALNIDKVKIYLYEVWTPLIPNRVIDITPCFEEKLMAMRLHKTQAKTKKYLDMIRYLNGYRACFANRDEIEQAEGFFECSLDEYICLVNQVYEGLNN